jgi:sigma-B regulation protein RsbU (phosphoserine phosphatase)
LICTCDAVGHGTSAALFAARVNTYVLTHARTDLAPCELVSGLNSYLCNRLGETGIYTTFYAMLLDFKSGVMTFAGAAHPPVIQFDQNKMECREWPSNSTYLGIMDPMPILCGSEQVQLNAGHRFLLYSDGLIEVQGSEQQLFGTERLSLALRKHEKLSGQALNNAILEQAEAFASNGFEDDVLLMSVVIK